MVAQEVKKYTKGVANYSFKHVLVQETVEAYFYTKLKPVLLSCYQKEAERSAELVSKLKQIQTLSIKTILDFLDIQSSFRLQRGDFEHNAYTTAINELSKLRYLSHPADKLVFLSEVHCEDDRLDETRRSRLS